MKTKMKLLKKLRCKTKSKGRTEEGTVNSSDNENTTCQNSIASDADPQPGCMSTFDKQEMKIIWRDLVCGLY